MTLLELLIKKLPQCAGWPKDAARCIYHEYKEGATFYDVEGAMVKNGVGFIDLCIPDVRIEEVTREQYEAALAASKPEWDGDGLPTVGCESQIILGKNGDLGVCEVLFIGSDIIVWRQKSTFAEGSSFLRNVRFLPIRSEEEKKRDEVANGLIEYLDKETDIDNVFSIKDVIGFYDAIAAGKIPHIRID